MSITSWQNRATEEIQSNHINGLQEAVGKIEDVLNMSSISSTGIAMTEVYISSDDRYRIYQASNGKRNWLSSPTPIVKKNGVVINSGFTIDYGGGALIFSPRLINTDVITVDATYMTNTSKAHKYFWVEEKTVLKDLNTLTLTNPVQSYMDLRIVDKTYGVEWLETVHWTKSGQVINFTSTMPEDLTFRITAI